MKSPVISSMLTATLAALMLLGAGCDSNDGPVENAGEQVDEAAEQAGDAVEDAADEVEEATD